MGRGLELTPAGELTLSYADEIFQIGRELEANLRNQADGKDILFRVGVADVVPKSIAYRLLAPGLTAGRSAWSAARTSWNGSSRRSRCIGSTSSSPTGRCRRPSA